MSPEPAMPLAPAAPAVLVLMGSPRRAGRCAACAEALARGASARGCEARVLRLPDLDVPGCTGCGACERTGECVIPGELARQGRRDGMALVLAALEEAQALALVSPVYFAGPPSQLKAVLDRLQPLWSRRYVLRTRPALPKESRKPALVVAVGAGGDPFGHGPLVECCRSALRMADYEAREACALIGPKDGEGRLAEEREAESWGAELAGLALARKRND